MRRYLVPIIFSVVVISLFAAIVISSERNTQKRCSVAWAAAKTAQDTILLTNGQYTCRIQSILLPR